MFQKLKDKWKVDGKDLLLILITFAVGGSVCGIAGKKIMSFFDIDKGLVWLIIYIIILTIIWPLCVLLISIPMGQFAFFKKYIRKIFGRMGGRKGEATVNSQQSAVSSQELAVSSQQSAVGSQQSAVGSQQSAVSSQESAVGSQQSAVGSQQSAVGSLEVGRRHIHVAIFASGAGSNAEKIIEHFKHSPEVKIVVIVCNKPGAGVLQIARQHNIDTLIIERQRFNMGDAYITELKKYNIQWIILAGFLWKLPSELVKEWPARIINIHPALLPKYGGKGMYGRHVHQAVIDARDKESGISIHYVDEIYDHGEVIMQARCEVAYTDTADTLAQKIHTLEHLHFPAVIEQEILKTINL